MKVKFWWYDGDLEGSEIEEVDDDSSDEELNEIAHDYYCCNVQSYYGYDKLED